MSLRDRIFTLVARSLPSSPSRKAKLRDEQDWIDKTCCLLLYKFTSKFDELSHPNGDRLFGFTSGLPYRQGASGLPRTTPPLALSTQASMPSGVEVVEQGRSVRITWAAMGEVACLGTYELTGFFLRAET